ncbi:hypothetical protein Poli38472_010579 [Pythium oligandrum]|uniref:GRIP domain-containing protein n=1 Tax=Pythium oligandrum TaxID=41045 RepID=A0A8K1FDK8_PYTOL|nr:hypothetical protein Poli38472_010579 [Pythium oligandrum]|eukprot:TMW55697.1 hypothetical protein Poli38472_010579 [Pythium oligandrum]
MWSRLTEYAGNVAEIVAPSEQGEHGELGEELWNKFTNIVAPTDGAEKTALDEDEDEQERYISELERALLQKKKQNEVLEQRIQELEAGGGESTGGVNAAVVREKDHRIAELEATVAAVKAQMVDVTKQASSFESETNRTLTAKLEAMEKRLRDLDVECNVLRAQAKQPTANTSTPDARNSIYSTLVQVTLQLAKSTQGQPLEIGDSEEVVLGQLKIVSERLRSEIERAQSQSARFQSAMSSFLAMHGERNDSHNELTLPELQSALGKLGHKLSMRAKDAVELEQLRLHVQHLTEKDEKSIKTISALQTQLSGVQASKLQNAQELADRESELMVAVQKKDATITKLQANENQLRETLNHLGSELDNANTELDELEKAYEVQRAELAALQVKYQDAIEHQVGYDQLQDRVRDLQQNAQEYEQGYLQLLQEAEQVKAKTEAEKAELVASAEAHVVSADKQRIYELEAQLSACEADKAVATQDAERLENELEALDRVLLQLQADHRQQKQRMLELEEILDSAQNRRRSSHNGSGVIAEEDFRRVMDVLSKKTLECDQLREALENTARQYSANEMLDKRLAAQLMVSYLESDKKHEVLLLISRMMSFDDDQKRRAGILSDGSVVIPGNGGGGLFSSLLGIGPRSQDGSSHGDTSDGARHFNTDEKAFSDLWADFLLQEAKK